MHRYIDSISVIERNKSLRAIQIKLHGYGTSSAYFDAFTLASSHAALHHLNAYVLTKTHFEDIHPAKFLSLLHEWLRMLEQHYHRKSFGRTRVALLVDKSVFLEVSALLHQLQQQENFRSAHILFDVFYSEDKARDFLQQGIPGAVLERV